MDNQQIYESRAYAGRELLKQDVALRISETINLFEYYYNAIVFAKEQSSLEEPQAEYVMYVQRAMRTANPFNKKIWLKKAEAAKDVLENTPEKITRGVNPNLYQLFLKKFAGLWVETKENISDKFWAKDTTKQELEDYFLNKASKGEHDPRKLLDLFIEYTESLTKCGILYFQYTSIKAGHSYLEGTG